MTSARPLTTPFSVILSGEVEEVEAKIENVHKYVQRLGADKESAPNGLVFVDGKHFEVDSNVLWNVQITGTQMFQHLQEQVRYLRSSPD